MATVHAEGGAGAGGHRLVWVLDGDDVADTVVLNVTHTRFDGSAEAGPPALAEITVGLFNGSTRVFDLLTIPAPSSGGNGVVNRGPQTFTGVRVRIDGGRGRVLSFTTNYTPPV